MTRTIAIYHKDCTDGTTAAAVVLRKYPEAKVFPLSHGFEAHELEAIMKEIAPGGRVLTVDCVIGVRELLALGHKVISIDHHSGISDEMKVLAKENKDFTFVFDNEKSGASLTWSTLFPNDEVPELVKRVEDADLWRWEYEDTKDVGNYLFMLTNKPEEVVKLFDAPLQSMQERGSVVTGYTSLMIDHSVKTTEPITVDIGGHHVPFYNITVFKSEAGNRLATERGKAVGLFSIDGGKIKISFRSLDGQSPSALDLAKALGGGGHANASGAGMKLEDFLKAIKLN